MGFQPFGYHFEICSTSSPAEVKSSIRSKKTDIFDAKRGARGWIAGPLICLWFSAFDRNGPMLFGIISQHNLGTRVWGRAGSDLNGLLAFTLMIPFMAFLVIKMIAEGSASYGLLLVIGLVFLVGGLLYYWISHKDRRDAEPLVRFLKNAILLNSGSAAKSIPRPMMNDLSLSVNGELSSSPLSHETIKDAFLRTGTDDVIILATAPENYIQTIGSGGGYIVEMRKGSASQHFKAKRRDIPPSSQESGLLMFDEAVLIFTAYASAAEMPVRVKWEPINLPG